METVSWTAKVEGDGWNGELWLSAYAAGYTHAILRVEATTEEIALKAVTGIYEMLAGGRKRYLRTAPRASSEQDFETQETVAKGYVRFSFRTEPGDEQIAAAPADGVLFSTLHPLTGNLMEN